MTTELDIITSLSHEFGTADYVKGGGGNTSYKNSDTLWVKPSGTSLLGLRPDTFVAMDRAKLNRLYKLAIPEDKTAREALVKTVMEEAVKPGQTARPSVEAPLHDAIKGAYVIHVHPALVTGLVCSRQAHEVTMRLFPDALWVPYVDPGFTLCREANRHIEAYRARCRREPDLLMLENHGVFVAGDTADQVRAIFNRVMTALRACYVKAGVPMDLSMRPLGAVPAIEASIQTVKAALGTHAAEVVYSAPFAAAEGPISPDHIVYGKSYAFRGPLSKAALEAFTARHGYPPRIIVTPEAVLGAGASRRQAQLALDFAQDGALVVQLAAAFGGLRYLPDSAREFIENWEVESYRARQMA